MLTKSLEKLLKNLYNRTSTQGPNEPSALGYSQWCVWYISDANGKNIWQVKYQNLPEIDSVFCNSCSAKNDLDHMNSRVITSKLFKVKEVLESIPKY